MSDREFRAKFTAETRDLERGADTVESKLKGVDGGVSKLGVAAGIAAGGLVAAGAAMWGLAEGAAEDERAAASLAKTLGNVAGATDTQVAAVEGWISAQGRALGVSDDQLRPALDALARGTKDVGEAQKLASLAMDISAGTGKDLTAVSEALAKAYNGQLGPLKKLDPALADLVKSGASADEVFAALGKTFDGQASEAAETTAGKLARVKLQFSEMGEELGAKALPLLVKFGDFMLTTVVPAIESVVAWVEANWPRFAAAVQSGVTAISNAWATYGQPVLDAIVGAVTGFIGIVQGAWSIFGDTITGYVTSAWGKVQTIIGGALEYVQGIWNTFSGLFSGDWGKMWDGIKQTVSGAWDLIRGIVGLALDGLKLALGLAWDGIKAAAATAWEGIKNKAAELWGGIKDAISGIVDDLKATVGTAVDGMVQFFTDLPGRILETMADIGSAALEIGAEILRKLGEGLSNTVEFAQDIGAAVAKAVKGAINLLIDKVNRALEFTIEGPFGVGSFTVNPPDIPKLHTGGVFQSGRGEGLALLQDGEGVFTEDQMDALPSLYGARGGSRRSYHITLVNEAGSDPAEAGRRVVEAIAAFENQSGASWRAGERAA